MSSAHIFAKSGSFFLMIAIRLDSRCIRSSLVIVLIGYSSRAVCYHREPRESMADLSGVVRALKKERQQASKQKSKSTLRSRRWGT